MFVFLFIFLRDLPKETVGRVRAVLIEVFIQMTIKKMVIKKMKINIEDDDKEDDDKTKKKENEKVSTCQWWRLVSGFKEQI